MSSIGEFKGGGDVVAWVAKIRAKLTSKGYRSHLLDANRPAADPARANWDAQADKALGVIQMHLDPNIAAHFEDRVTPQMLLEAIIAHYRPDMRQEVDRLENELAQLTYDGTDPVVWSAKIRGLVTKLTARQAAPTERTVRNLVLRALEQEPEYKIRVEVIRHSNPDITLLDLWAAIGRFPYSMNRDTNLYTVKERIPMEKGRDSGQRGRDKPPAPRPRPKYSKAQQEQYKKDIEKRNCFKCHKSGHTAWQCTEEEYGKSGDDTDSSEDERKKQKGKSKEKAKPNHFAFFAQEVQEKESATPTSQEFEVEFVASFSD